jgi:hypothetical protein
MSLQQAHATRASSRANESDDAEAVQLRQQLKDRGKEIEAIRSELDGFKRLGAPDETETNNNEQPRTRPVTPEPNLFVVCLTECNNRDTNTCNSPGTPMRLNVPTISTPSRPIFGVRTQSGSFISAISKQPTPAPSTPGIDDDDDPFAMNDNNVFDDHSGQIPQNGARMTLGSGVVTPALTSTNVNANRVAELVKEIEKYKLVATEARKQADGSQQEAQSNVCLLLLNSLNAFEIQETSGLSLTSTRSEARRHVGQS